MNKMQYIMREKVCASRSVPGIMKGTAVSNLVTNIMGVSEEPAGSAFSTFKKRMYEKYKIPYDEEAIE